LKIILWPNPILTARCLPVAEAAFGKPWLIRLAEDMIATMQERHGVGLAGPQVGVARCVFVMERRVGAPLAVCNPRLEVKEHDTALMEEGCLSLPGIRAQVQRPRWVRMFYLDVYGVAHESVLLDLDARTCQHEMDHLEGRLFFVHLSRQMRREALRKWDDVRWKVKS